MVGVSVEFDGQPSASAFDHEVDAEPAYPVLDLDAVSAGDEVAVDVAFEVGVKAAACLAGRVVDACGVLAVADEPAADVVGMQFVGGDRADALHLVLGAVGGDVIRCRCALFGHRPDPPAFARGDDDGQEHDVALVDLEVVGVAAADPPPPWSPISRKFFAPASTHPAATASMNTSGYRRPRLMRASGTRAKHLQQAGQLVIGAGQVVKRACDPGRDGLPFRLGRGVRYLDHHGGRPSPQIRRQPVRA